MQYHQSAGGIVVGPTGQIVVVSQNGDSWSLPKGRLEPGETEEQAAQREIYEEAGLKDVEIVEKLGSYERPVIALGGIGEDKETIKHITLYLCKTTQTELRPVDPQNPEAIWVNRGEVTALLTHPKDKEFYEQQLPKIERLRA
jgi:8-oxo-dGTP pyrophosphatase MutT (NUDIX family)